MVTEIKKHEISSLYETDGRTFKINSYDPMIGNYLLMQILTNVLPLGIGAGVSKKVGTEKIPLDTSGNAKMMDKKDFIQLQVDILSTVEEVYQSGQTSPVVRENGTYGTNDVTMLLLIKLIIASLAFNFKDFFADVLSKEDFIENLSSKFAGMKI